MAPQPPWSPTAHAFAQHQFSHVANFWKLGRPASFRLEALPNGQAELSLKFHIPSASEVVPPPLLIPPVSAPQRPIPPLFPSAGTSKRVPLAEAKTEIPKEVSYRKRKSYRRAVLHRAATTALSLPTAGENTLRSLAKAAVAAATTARAVSCLIPQNCGAVAGSLPPVSLSPAYLSPNSLPPNSLSPNSLSPASLSPAPLPPASLSLAEAGCSSSSPPVPKCPNCEEELNATHQCDDVPLASSSGTNDGLCDMAKTLSDCATSCEMSKTVNCQELASMATTGQSTAMPAKPDPPRLPGRILNMKKFCETCDCLVSIRHKCQA